MLIIPALPSAHAGVAAQRYVAVGVNLYRRYVLEHVGGGHAGVVDVLRHVERLAVHLEPHAWPLRRHRHLLERLAVFCHVHVAQVFVLVLLAEGELAAYVGVADVRQLHGIVAVGQLPYVELPLVVGHGSGDELLRRTVENGHVHVSHRLPGGRVNYLSLGAALRVAYGCAQQKHPKSDKFLHNTYSD